MFLTTGQHLSW